MGGNLLDEEWPIFIKIAIYIYIYRERERERERERGIYNADCNTRSKFIWDSKENIENLL